MKKALVLFLALLIQNALFSQEVDFKEAFLDGDYFMMYEEYADALPFYLQLYDQEPDNANICYRIGVCYINMPGQKEKAIPYLEKAIRNTTDAYRERDHREKNAPLDAYYYLGSAYRIQNELSKARLTFERYLTYIDRGDTINLNFVQQQIAACNNAEKYMKNPVYFDAVNVGPPVNDNYANINAISTPDETALVYVTGLKFYDAIFYSEKKNGQWTEPVNLSPQILSDGDLYPTCLSASGDKLLLSKDEDFNSDIYISRLQDGLWTPAEKLGKNINTKFWENHACVSQDGKTMIFTSNKPGGYGGFDLYLSEYDETLQDWGPAVNMGPVINTQFNEETPFLVNKGQTIYFSSQGHENIGGYDVFTTTKDENLNWTTPVNLGYPINTTDDDLFFMPVKDGINAYFARFTGNGYGMEDIYRYDIFSDRNPRNVLITGKVRLEDRETIPETGLTVKLTGPAGTEIQSLAVDPATSSFNYSTRKPGQYTLRFEGEGYEHMEKNAMVPDDYSLAMVEVNATLMPVKLETIVLKNIYFEFDRNTIKPAGKETLEKLVAVLAEYPQLRIEITGHTDSKGPDNYNQRLSERRAKSVADFLVEKGVEKSRLVVNGMGEKQPIALNTLSGGKDSPEGRELNRRVEIHVIEPGLPHIVTEKVLIPDALKIK